jgi:hypothetical protein
MSPETQEKLAALSFILLAVLGLTVVLSAPGCTPEDDDDATGVTPTTSPSMTPEPTPDDPTPLPEDFVCPDEIEPVPCASILAPYLANGGTPPEGCLPDAHQPNDGQE